MAAVSTRRASSRSGSGTISLGPSSDDATYPARAVGPYLTAHGIPEESIFRIADCGHYPNLEQKNFPEARARNVAQIVRCVDAMLTASREGTPLSTLMASTLLGDAAA